jgi:hypothetical protein
MRMLTRYFAAGSSSMAPHIALHEIGVPFESRPISLAKKENRTPAYLAINPEGHVPTLLIDGRPLTESSSIAFRSSSRIFHSCSKHPRSVPHECASTGCPSGPTGRCVLRHV